MPAPKWFWRHMYDRESDAWVRRRDRPEHREVVERIATRLSDLVESPGPIADLGCGPGAHARALAQRGYQVIGLDGAPRMVEAARARAARDRIDVEFRVGDVREQLPFDDNSLGGALAVLVVQHLPAPEALVAEVRRCLRPGGHAFLSAPSRSIRSATTQNLYWRLRAAVLTRLPGVIRHHSADELAALVSSSGMTVVELDETQGGASVIARA